MGKTKVKESKKPLTLSKVVVYILLILLAITIIIPVGWVFVASVKQNSEFYGSPWVLPEKIYFQNFIDAWEKASMGTYMLNSVIVTALALLLLIVIFRRHMYCPDSSLKRQNSGTYFLWQACSLT